MKRLLLLTVLGVVLSGVAGCRFMECLWRGGPPCQQQAPAMMCPSPYATYSGCDPCGGASAAVVTPGVEAGCVPAR
jgi:hypothetical protein